MYEVIKGLLDFCRYISANFQSQGASWLDNLMVFLCFLACVYAEEHFMAVFFVSVKSTKLHKFFLLKRPLLSQII